ncbi:MAG TPA: hypothetical protein VGI05_14030, partial [Streptosporangiaceae bacterium]
LAPLVMVGTAATAAPPDQRQAIRHNPGYTKETAMHPAHRSAHRTDPGRWPDTAAAAMASPGPDPADLVHRRHLEKMVSWTGPERLRCLWYRLRLTVAEMNYATRRVVELQAPWICDDQPSH